MDILASLPQLPHSPQAASLISSTNADARDDRSMQLSSGSLVFVVQGVRFKVGFSSFDKALSITKLTPSLQLQTDWQQIPKALLQLHSEAFADMLQSSSWDNSHITLDDPLEAFEDYVATMLTYVG